MGKHHRRGYISELSRISLRTNVSTNLRVHWQINYISHTSGAEGILRCLMPLSFAVYEASPKGNDHSRRQLASLLLLLANFGESHKNDRNCPPKKKSQRMIGIKYHGLPEKGT
ncbi:hypothetical protein CDAR_108131 [Caerostris darwini]|uniref:Uncharacterized protein n=1 Tax=Caerostris darwini TaxID=1538125 RepID=A0AAV4X2U7_9ARAC|nr:hypothetical protein CDAR_108131 [Caerostris darwini]